MRWPAPAGGTPERSGASSEATAPSSIAERSFSVPPKVPKPVRTPEKNTTSVFEPWVFIGGKLHVRRGEYRGDGGRAVGRGDLTCSRLPRAKRDRKSTRLNSSHRCISYAVFCLTKKKRAGEAEPDV